MTLSLEALENEERTCRHLIEYARLTTIPELARSRATYVRSMVEDHGLTQYEVAARLGLSRTTVQKILSHHS